MNAEQDLYLHRKEPMGNSAWLAAIVCLSLALADAIAGLFAGIGYRLDMWGYRDGIGALPYVFWLAVCTAVISALAVMLGATAGRRGAVVVGVLALLIAATTAYIPWSLRQQARSVPAI